MTQIRALRRVASVLTTPLAPEDILGLVNPLSSARQLRGVVTKVVRETPDSATIHFRPGRGWKAHAGRPVGPHRRRDRRRAPLAVLLAVSAAVGHDPAITVTAIGFVSDGPGPRHRSGDVLFLDTPQGDFVLPEHPRPLLMLTAGSGLTPVMSMIRTLVPRRPDADVVLIHSARTRDDALFREELAELADQFPGPPRHATGSPARTRPHRPRPPDATDLETLCPRLARAAPHTPAVPPSSSTRRPRCGSATATTPTHDQPDHRTLRTRAARRRRRRGGLRDLRDVRPARSRSTATTPSSKPARTPASSCPAAAAWASATAASSPCVAGQVRDLRTGEVHGDEGELIQTCVSAAAGPVHLDI